MSLTIESLSNELIQDYIYSELSDTVLAHCELANRLLQDNANAVWKRRESDGIFGKREWAMQGYEIEGEVEPIPEKMKEALEAPCPIYPDKKGKETWKVVYKPKTINGQPTTINYFGTLLGAKLNPPQPTGYSFIWDEIQQQLGDVPVEKGEWLMILTYGDGLVPESRGKSFSEQQALVKAINEKGQGECQVLHLIDAMTGIFAIFVKSKSQKRLYGDKPLTLPRCQEKIENYQLVVGGFAPGGLVVNDDFDLDHGVGVQRKFRPLGLGNLGLGNGH